MAAAAARGELADAREDAPFVVVSPYNTSTSLSGPSTTPLARLRRACTSSSPLSYMSKRTAVVLGLVLLSLLLLATTSSMSSSSPSPASPSVERTASPTIRANRASPAATAGKKSKTTTPQPTVRRKKPVSGGGGGKKKPASATASPTTTPPEEEVDYDAIEEEEEDEDAVVDEDDDDEEEEEGIIASPDENAEDYSEEEELARERDNEPKDDDDDDDAAASPKDDDDDPDAEEDEDDEGKEMFTAPRSKPELVYNQIKPRGVLYWPSGGMSNQILELENALQMAHLLNRTLYVSKIGSHNYLMQGYNKLRNFQLFPADRLLDMELMSQWADVVPLNVSTKRFVSSFAAKDVFAIKSAFASFGPHKLKDLKLREEKLLLWSGAGMWHRWFSREQMQLAERHTAYSPYLRDLAIRLASKAMKGKPFYAIHGRLGDETHFWEGKNSREAFMNTNTFRRWDKSLKIYLASDCPTCIFFRSLRETKRVVTLDDLLGLDEMKEFSSLFSSVKVRRDMVGILDKLMCAQAVDFLGSKFSTFTWDILRYRQMRKDVFPELFVEGKEKEGKP